MQSIRRTTLGPRPLQAALVSVGLLLGACQTPQAPAVPAFRLGVTAAAAHTAEAFDEINRMIRAQQLERALEATTLNEELFGEALPQASLASWDRAFAAIEAYASKIEVLLDPEQREGIEEELRGLGAQFEEVSGESISPGVASAFSQFGGLLVELRAGQKALEIMQATDPQVRAVFETMAMAIGESNEEGVRLTVWASWTTSLGGVQLDFMDATDADAKREVAQRYLDMLAERTAHDLLLAQLRRSLLTLAQAHRDLAHGRRMGASALLAEIRDEYGQWKRAKDQAGNEGEE